MEVATQHSVQVPKIHKGVGFRLSKMKQLICQLAILRDENCRFQDYSGSAWNRGMDPCVVAIAMTSTK